MSESEPFDELVESRRGAIEDIARAQAWCYEVLVALATEYKQWFELNDIKFVSWQELGELLKDGLDEARIWTLEDLWDGHHFTLSSGVETTYRGMGFVPYFGSYPDSDETEYAISSNVITAKDSSVLKEVLVACKLCVDEDGDEDADPDCEFCEGELEVSFDLKVDGTYQLS